MSEIGKGASGLVGFPTPNNAADVEAYLLFLFPDQEWAQYVLGAVKNLTVPYNWYQAGEMTPEDAAEAFRLIVEQAPYNIRYENVPAPYWDEDSADDADDEAPRDDQPWYGVLVDDNLTWVENVGFWAVTAFVAIAATPAAAIAFVPIARRFTVAFKKHDLGGIVRAFIDGAEVGAADTYASSDSVGEMTIVMPEPAMGLLAMDTPHTLWLSMSDEVNPAVDGAPNIQLLRKRLTESDVIPPNQRYNPETDMVEFSPDGGETWINSPSLDPRHSDTFRYPPLVTVDTRCDASANMRKWLKDFLDQATELICAGATALAIANTAIPLYELISGGSLTLLALITEAAGTLFGLGCGALEAAFDEDVYDLIMCIFDCQIGADGQVSPGQFLTIQTQIDAQLTTTAALITNLILSFQGEVGLSNAGTIGGQTGDCSECECTWEITFNFSIDEQSWYTTNWLDGYPAGYYNAACCFQSTVDHAGGHQVLPIAIDLIMPTGSQLRSFTSAGFEGAWTALLWDGTYYNTYPPTITNDVSAGTNTLTAYLVANLDTACRFYTITIGGTGGEPTY